jgi:AcrR family transcriptional regulator
MSSTDDFDQALIKGAFDLAAREGWAAVSVAGAAREAGVALELARDGFPGRAALLLALGRMADRHALTDAMETGAVRERLFDMLMRRFDVLQQHRAGVLALLRALPADPGEALLLATATSASMGWMLEAAGVSARGLAGALRVQGLVGVWLYALRAWRKDESADLSVTMAALDRALHRAEQAAGWLARPAEPAPAPKPFPEPSAVSPVLSVADSPTGAVLDAGPASPASAAEQP